MSRHLFALIFNKGKMSKKNPCIKLRANTKKTDENLASMLDAGCNLFVLCNHFGISVDQVLKRIQERHINI